MIKHFRSYCWIKGRPYGKNETETSNAGISYKIVPDPYHRRFSIEKYNDGRFESIVYDSFLLDFRHLYTLDQAAWQKVTLEENRSLLKCLLINQDDRAVLTETYLFENDLCRSCLIQSIHGVPVATNRMYYKAQGDPFNGIILYDSENCPVIKKTYDLDPISGEFSTLSETLLDMTEFPNEETLLKSILNGGVHGKVILRQTK